MELLIIILFVVVGLAALVWPKDSYKRALNTQIDKTPEPSKTPDPKPEAAPEPSDSPKAAEATAPDPEPAKPASSPETPAKPQRKMTAKPTRATPPEDSAPEESPPEESAPEEETAEESAPEEEAAPPEETDDDTRSPLESFSNRMPDDPETEDLEWDSEANAPAPLMAPTRGGYRPPARPPEGIREAQSSLPEDERIDVQRIYFGTDRNIASVDNKGASFGSERARKLTLGCTDITIPKKAHQQGKLERPKQLKVLSIKLWSQKEDPQKHFTIEKTEILTPEEFTSWAGATAALAKNYVNTAFMFIHGFNTPFDAAMFRAAQLAYDLKFDGPAFAYSWPSVGQTLDYVTDMDSADGATPYLDEFLDLVLQTPGVETLHLVAHSMGNAALAEFLTQAGTRLQARQSKPIGQMILASPDLDAGEFEQISGHFTKQANNVTIYACANDRALMASQKVRDDHPRLGDVEDGIATVVPGVDTIDVTAVGSDVFSLNHNVFAQNRSVLDDLARLFKSDPKPPKDRMPTLEEIPTPKGVFWRMPG